MKRRFKVYAMIRTSFVTEVEMDTQELPTDAEITKELCRHQPNRGWHTHYPTQITSEDTVDRIVEVIA